MQQHSHVFLKKGVEMPDLKTNYLGMELKSPLVASASALSKKLDNIKKMEEAGLGAVVLYSLFEEEIIHESLELDYFLTRGTESFAEAITYFPDLPHYNLGPDRYLELIQKAKESVGIPVIGSLNGISTGGWIKYAKLMEDAGADALELNMYFIPTDLDITAQELENAYLQLIKDVRQEIQIPLAVKLSPFFTSLPNFAELAARNGADGLVLFNRFYQPDLDIDNLEVVPCLELSTSADLLLPLRWIAILYKKVNPDLALTSGVHTGRDAAKAIMAGASVAMIASELVGKGIERAADMLQELTGWMAEHEYESVHQMQGVLSQRSVPQPAAFERANYMKALKLFDNRL
jgi:dihydroorotate dehydrogenase (fumarate)